jgi:hypothetical protein
MGEPELDFFYLSDSQNKLLERLAFKEKEHDELDEIRNEAMVKL